VKPVTVIEELGFYRLKQILQMVPFGKSAWWNGVKEGKFPQPVKLKTVKVTCWRKKDIHDLVKRLEEEAAG
jgi:predicted DNA-binding transcriptional regulator AlpA